MALSKNRYVNKVSILLNEDGDVVNSFQESVELIKDDEVVLSTINLPISQLSANTIASALPDQATLLTQIQSLKDENIANKNTIANLEAKVSTDAMKISELEAKASTDATKISTLEAKASTDAMKISELETKASTDAMKISELETKYVKVEFKPLTSKQIRLGLLKNGIKSDAIDAIITSIPDSTQKEEAKILWEFSDLYNRDHPLIEQIGVALQLTKDQIDDMWKYSETL